MIAVTLAAIACAGCAAPAAPPKAPSPPAITIAVFAPTWATSPAPLHADTEALLSGLRSQGGVRALLLAEDAACAAEPPCLQRALADLPASKALSVRLAALGDTVLVRGSLLDAARGTQDESRQTVVQNASEAALATALSDLGRAFAAPYAPPPPSPKAPTPIVRSGWFWAVLSAAVVGTGAAIGGAVWASQPKPDVVITPP